jgi:hypothetical protein
MFKSITANAITAVTVAALPATLMIFLTPGVVLEAKAHSLPAPAETDPLPAIATGNAWR